MNSQTDRAKEVFLDALDIPSADARRAFLDRACGGDPELRAEVEGLLAHHPQVGSFLASGVRDPDATASYDAGAADGPGTVVGSYRLMEQIGEGGFGLVFVAEQIHPLRRRVAVKVIKPGMDTREVVARFEAERQALALMDHPHIARVIDAGATPSGRPYFVMELVRGSPITKYCDDHHLTPRDRLGLFADLCAAVQHAHQKGVIHRDLKPSNVMVASHDGIPVVKVIDFGVAKAVGPALTDKTVYTRFTQMVGTPLYMSPEQAGSSGLDVDTRTDIYALGVLLYELLTGATPFDQERLRTAGYDEIRRIIREEEPARPSTRISTLGMAATTASANRGTDPRRLSALIRGELDWIVMKALEKDRTRRYDTASAFSADVRRFLTDEPVQACPPAAWYRFRKFTRRNRAGVLTAAGVALGLLLAVGGAFVVQAAGNARIKDEQKQTKDALDREKQTTDALTRSLENEERAKYFRSIALAERELAAGNVGQAAALLDDCPVRLRGWEWHHLNRRPYGTFTFRGHASQALGVAFSPDGKHVASTGLILLFGEVLIWDRVTGKVVHRLLGHTGPVEGVAYSPDGKRLATAGWDKTVRVWDAVTGEKLHTLRGHAEYVRSVAFSADGELLASAGGDRTVVLWDAITFGEKRQLKGHTGGVFGIAFGPDGRLASVSSDGTVRLWNTATGREEHVLWGHAGPVLGVAFSTDGKRIASAGFDGTARVWDAASGRHARTIRADNFCLTCVAFSRDGKRLAAGNMEKTVRLWDLDTEHEALSLRGHDDMVLAVTFSPDGQQLASASLDGKVKLWDAAPVRDGPGTLPLRGHTGAVFGLAFRLDGGTPAPRPLLASGSLDETVKVWDTNTGEEVRTLAGHAGPVARVAFSRDGRRLLSADYSGIAKVWDAATFKEVRAFRAFAGIAALGPDGRRVALTAEGAWVEVRDADTGEEVCPPFRAHDAPILSVAFSSDGNRLATAGWDGTAKVWDLSTGRAVHTLVGHTHVLCWVVFSDDGTRLATASWDKTVKVWDAATGKEVITLRGHTDRVLNVAFSPDGKRLATASQDVTVRVWNAATGAEIAALKSHAGYVLSVAFSPDGKRLASSSGYRGKGEVKVWDATKWSKSPDRK